MQWFAGNVETAIQISRRNKALFIVYITTDNEDGRLFDEYWQNIDASNLLCPVVGIKLKAGENASLQFSEIYPTPILPAVYLINHDGKPLEVITTLVGGTYDQFRAKFGKATAQFVNGLPPSVVTPDSTSSYSSAAPAQITVPAVPQPSTAVESIPTPVQVSQQSSAPFSVQQEMTPELAAKVAKAKALIEQKKQKDAEKKRIAEKELKEEMNKAREAKQERDDKALVEAAKKRRQEKIDSEKEKQRILAQIKADREDAQKRFGSTTNTLSVSTEKVTSKVAAVAGKATPSDRCRIQVRLPDGTSFVEEFSSNDVFHSLVKIVQGKPSIAGNDFEIQQLYPRRVFTFEDYSKTFLDNQLTPSTALVVIQKSKAFSLSSNPIRKVSTPVFSWIFFKINVIWNIFCGMIGWVSNKNKREDAENKKAESTEGKQAPQSGRRGMPRSAEVRRRGNIAGLENPNDDDPEERANFNGNSTQFM